MGFNVSELVNVKLRVVTAANGAGMQRDAAIFARMAQTAGLAPPSVVPIPPSSRLDPLTVALRSLVPRFKVDLQVFIERAVISTLPDARFNWLMPNGEWFYDSWIPRLRRYDRVLVKSRHGERIFAALGARTSYVGWTSIDLWDPVEIRDWDRPLHVAGSSEQKGTAELIDVWRSAPHFPELTIIASATHHPDPLLPNVRMLGRVSDDELKRLMNERGIHLCPSNAEAFGHTIAESLSTGAVVLTTDAPAMNELVDRTCGVLVAPSSRRPYRLDSWYEHSRETLASGLSDLFSLSIGAKRDISLAARRRWESNDKASEQNMLRELNSLISMAQKTS